MYLAQWARQHGVSTSTAYRWFRKGQLPEGVTARRTPSGSIEVETDPLGEVDIHALVRRMHEHGYVVLTRSQARQLGVKSSPEPGGNPSPGPDKETDREGD